MLNSAEIEQGLTRLGFDVNVDKVRIHSAHRDDMEHTFYTKIAAAGSIMAFTVQALIIGYIVYKLFGFVSSKS